NGLHTFPFTIRNQFTTALSTSEAARNMRTKVLDYQRDFYFGMREENNRGGYVFRDSKVGARARHLAEILRRHRIVVR
ncbi:hypothetical protein, partial [Robiginitalea biformata]|uniref:hypothetical protein n=1 Tax=Robiginitalea biformata TaxID=252307 RepID=UPI003D33304C